MMVASVLGLPLAAATPIWVGACIGPIEGAQQCVMAQGAPTGFEGEYDEDTQTLKLEWDAVSPAPDKYVVYRDDISIGEPTTPTFDDDLTTVVGVHYYYVVAVKDGIASLQSNTLWLGRFVGVPPDCSIAEITIYYNPPGIIPTIYEDCLPP